jgi:hypothetical protein
MDEDLQPEYDPEFDYADGKMEDSDDMDTREIAYRQKKLLQDPETQGIVIEGGEDFREANTPSAMEELIKGLKKTPETEMDESTR